MLLCDIDRLCQKFRGYKGLKIMLEAVICNVVLSSMLENLLSQPKFKSFFKTSIKGEKVLHTSHQFHE